MEHWIVYDVETGLECWRGGGAAGSSTQQVLPEGLAIVIVPMPVVAAPVLDLTALRTALAMVVDADAERVRQRFLTPGAGQALTYVRKEAEARAWHEDHAAPTPFLSAEAASRKMQLASVVAEVIGVADAWTFIGSQIEGLRMGAKRAVSSATTLGAIIDASQVNWNAIDVQAG